ncbi:hypothetical protein C8J57DRAFT_1247472 [Mycena rebaudengoi]|nr:hypothetical protein C8J57DRAFT_1247472 [Mycena rebaudengoi]
MKNIGQGESLQCKLIIAITERACQVDAFKEVSRTAEKEVKQEWQEMIDTWLADPEKPNRYVLDKTDVPSEVEVRRTLKKDEEEEVGGRPYMGQIEESQHRIIAELGRLALVVADRDTKIQEALELVLFE